MISGVTSDMLSNTQMDVTSERTNTLNCSYFTIYVKSDVTNNTKRNEISDMKSNVM